MKKNLLLLSLVFIAITVFGQTSIPNGNFETWNSGTYYNPLNYPYTSNPDAFSQYSSFNVVKTADAYHGNFAVMLTSYDKNPGYFLNSAANGDNPSNWTGGMPYTEMPTGIRGYYKYNVATGDSAVIIVIFRKAGASIGTYIFNVGDVHSTYTLFNYTFTPALTQSPDSVIFGAVSSNIMSNKGIAGSVLYLDSASFTGVSSQPALMNGDFESWQQNQTPYTLANWFSNNNSQGINRTSDVPTGGGQYAVEITTYSGQDNQGNPQAQSGQISTGYYPQNCNGNCSEMGGVPFSNQVDTLAFWYKYSPSANETDDSAQIVLNFKKHSNNIWGMQQKLPASQNYQYAELPFNINNGQYPDTVNIQIMSSAQNNNSLALSCVGSDLKIDNLHFKTLPPPPSISIATPSASTYWQSGTSQNIEWTSININQSETIQYSTDGGTSWNGIATITNPDYGNNFYSWTVTNNTGNNNKIRVLTNDGLIGDTSDVFAIGDQPHFIFTQPTTGTKWATDQPHNFTITNNGPVINSINIYISTDGGNNWNGFTNIGQLNPGSNDNPVYFNSGQYPQDYPNCILAIGEWGQYGHFITEAESETFEIIPAQPTISVIQPFINTYWQSGTTQVIAWNSINVNQDEKIQYSINSGSSWNDIATITNTNINNNGSNSYSWNSVASVTGQVNTVIRVISDDSSIGDTSAVFIISDQPQFVFTQPTTGTKWTAGQSGNIAFTNNGPTVNNANFYLSTDGGSTWNNIMNPGQINNGSNNTQWYINNGQFTQDYPNCILAIRVYDQSWNYYTETKSETFEIVPEPASITVNQPFTGTFWQSGTTQMIAWNSISVNQDEKIQYSINSGSSWNDITTIAMTNINYGTNTYTWNSVVSVSGQINSLIRVISNDGTVGDTSALFIISDQPQFVFTQPTTGTQWTAGQSYNISITNNGPAINNSTNIYLSSDGGVHWNNFANVRPLNSGSNTFYRQVDPSTTASTNCIMAIRIYDQSMQYYTEVRSETFEILPAPSSITVSQPSTGTFWQSGTSQTIEWTSLNVNQNEKIQYSINSGSSWNDITTLAKASISNGSNTYTWSSVASVTGQVNTVIRVISVDGSIGDTSDVFTLSDSPLLVFSQPTTSTQWTAGQSYQIVISNQGASFSQSGDLYLSTDGGTHWNNLNINIWQLNSGSNIFNWMIADTTVASVNCKLAFSYQSGVNQGWPYYTESGTFTILPAPASITVNQPLADAYWQNGTQDTIKWTSVNINQNEKIQYSINGGANWNDITTITGPLNGQYNYIWTPNVSGINKNSLVRVITADLTVYGISGVFTLSDQPQFVFTQPTTGTQWQVGQEYVIMLQNNGSGINSSNELELELSSDGSSWNNVLSAGYSIAEGQNAYYWTIDPATLPSTNYQLSIVKNSWQGTTRYATSQLFEIQAAAANVTITKPVAGSYWQSSTLDTIRWTSASVASVNIEYSIDNGATWAPIVSGYVSNNGSNDYSWTVPVVSGTINDARIRISDASNPSTQDVSNLFTISNEPIALTVTSPNGGEEWIAGYTYLVQFYNQGPTQSNIGLLYSSDGTTWHQFAWGLSVPIGVYTYNWQIPSGITPLSTYKIKVQAFDNMSNPTIGDTSNSFSIVAPAINLSVTSPGMGYLWQSGTMQNINWNSTGITFVNIDYSLDGGNSWNSIVSNIASADGTNSYLWTVVTVLQSTYNARIRISDASNPLTENVSDLFTIGTATPYLKVIQPNGGEVLQAGNSYTIKFENGGSYINEANLYLSTDNGQNWSFIDNIWNVNTGINTYNWNVSSSIANSSNCLIRLSDSLNQALRDSSDNVFTIASATQSISINNPQSGAWWVSGISQNIAWNSTNVSNINIFYSIDGGTSWNSIASNVPASNGYNFQSWNVAAVPEIEYASKIKIEDASNSLIKDVSDLFTISNEPLALTVISPNGGEVWTAGNTYSIKYNNSGAPNSNGTNISVSTDNGNTWNNIGTDWNTTHGVNSHSWTVPTSIATSVNCLIAVTNWSIGSDTSDNVFKISNPQPFLSIDQPQGGEWWMSDSLRKIKWTTVNISSVNISYSLDGGLNWSSVATSVPSTDGQNTYDWTLPVVTQIYHNCKIKIESSTPSLLALSNVFTIAKENQFMVLAPTTGDVWFDNQSYNISFKNNSGNNLVDLFYSTDGGNTWSWSNYIGNPLATNGNNTYNWTIPSAIASQNCVIGVNWNGNWFISNTFEISDQPPVLTITNPTAVCSPSTIDITSNLVINNNTHGGVLSYWKDTLTTIPLNLPGAISSSATYFIKSTNPFGSDIEPVKVTVNPAYAFTENHNICNGETYNWHGTDYSTADTYTASYKSINGCDSIYTLHLAVNTVYAFTENHSICNGETYHWHGTDYTTADTYTASYVSINGCDSVYTLHLTINNSTTSSTSHTACDSYLWNGTTYTTSGDKTFSTTNSKGCDSTATLHLTINSSTTSSTSHTACDSYVWNGMTYTTSGDKTFSTTNSKGCDSTATLHLTINTSTTGSITVAACKSYTWFGTTYTTSGTPTHVIPNKAGCDSTITLHLTINNVDTSVTVNGTMLTANVSGASYQWVNCNSSYSFINGETHQSFTATSDGSYAVIVTKGSCSDTSSCYPMITTSIEHNSFGSAFNLYPNPTSGNVTLDLGGSYDDVVIMIKNVLGQVISNTNASLLKTVDLKIDGTPGIYFVNIITAEGKTATIKVIKN